MKILSLPNAWTLIALGLVVSAYSHANVPEWTALNRQSDLLYQQGQYTLATDKAKQALQIAEQSLGPDHTDVASSLNRLALLYSAQGRYSQAEPL